MDQLVQTVILLVLMGAIFYFMLIRPQRKRQQEHQRLIGDLKRGDKVITNSGICGVIKKVDRDRIWVEVEEGATLKMIKDSVVEKEQA
jgi:preprotein translocase subunit YajC